MTWRMPAEWERHERCLMAWPTRRSLWGRHFARAKREYAATANAIAEFEPVTMVTNPGQAGEVRKMCSSGVEVMEVPIDDSWMRDSGPILAIDDEGGRRGVDFTFNSWGERFAPWDKDNACSEQILAQLGIERLKSQMVLEGGAITVDGEGTLITTEQCLLNPNRNPSMSRADMEAELARTLGIEKVVWLPFGQAEDEHTDGHVDGVAAYIGPGRVLVQACSDPANPNYEIARANRAVLETATDARGRKLELVEIDLIPYAKLGRLEVAGCYPNFYIANGGVVVPIAGVAMDEVALDFIGDAMPGHEVVGVESNVIAYGGGGTHCITQQVPAA